MSAASFGFVPEFASADDAPIDFCLWDYAPPAAVRAGSLRGVNLLYAAAERAGGIGAYRRLASSLRTTLGPFRTVWGAKKNGPDLSSEFYFYDYERVERAVPFTRIAQAFAPVADVQVRVDDAIPYFMNSIELPLALTGDRPRVSTADIYVGNPGSGVSSGICYEVGGEHGPELKNFYFFFDAKEDRESVVAKAGCSALLPFGSIAPDELFPDWSRDARVLVIANKRRHDALYVSGIGIDALIGFLDQFDYPADLVSYAREQRARFDHLQFDVGFDYRVENGRLVTSKSSFYNVL